MAKKKPAQELKPSDKLEEAKKRLKELNQLQQARVEHWKTQEREMINGRKQSIQDIHSERGRKLKAAAQKRDAAKEAAKAAFQNIRDLANTECERKIREAKAEVEKKLDDARPIHDEAIHAATHEYNTVTAPVCEKAKAELEEIERDFVNEMEAIKKARKKDLDELAVKIDEVRESLDLKPLLPKKGKGKAA